MDDVWSAPVRFGECDRQGVVFNAHYMTYADEACNAWFHATGTPHSTLAQRGLDSHLKASNLVWSAPAAYEEVVVADVVCTRIGTSSMVLVARLRVGERLCCTVDTTYVVVDREGRAVRVPDDLRAAYGG